MAFTLFNVPGSLIFFPSTSIFLPASRTSKAMALARRVDVVLRLILYATKKSLAPITVAPRLASNSAGPKSGFHCGSFIFLKKPSYSPARITDKLFLLVSGCAASYK